MRRIDDRLEPALGGSVVSIGNFDGVHRGHEQLLRRLVDRAAQREVPSVVVTFDPHPLTLLRPEKAPRPITDLDEKARRLERLGLDVLLVLRFDWTLASMEPEAFLETVIVGQLRPLLLVVGHDFNFGRDRKGTIELLRAFCAERGIELDVVDAVERGGQRVSSSGIRRALGAGRLDEACALMGHPYSVEGPVVPGARRGRTLGFPTANLRVPQLLVPAGVYRGRALWRGGAGPAAINVGVRPTFGGAGEPLVEVHVLDAQPDLYGERLRVEFLERLRPEMRFDGPESLRRQIQADVEAVRAASEKDRLPDVAAAQSGATPCGVRTEDQSSGASAAPLHSQEEAQR